MEAWLIIILTISLISLLKALLSSSRPNLPPGPTCYPILGNLLWLQNSFSNIEQILHKLKLKYGSIFTLKIGSITSIFINSHSLAHTSLIENGAVFSDRPQASPITKFISCNRHNINSATYGPMWRLFRRNLSSEVLHPSRVKSFSNAREWVLNVLVQRLNRSSDHNVGVRVVDDFQFAMFGLLVLMCFGDKLEEKEIKEIERVQRGLLLNLKRFTVLDLWPRLGRVLFYNKWSELKQFRRNQESVLIPFIKSRLERLQSGFDQGEEVVTAYVDTLLKLKLPEEGDRKLSFAEIVSLCSEFLNAGTDTTTAALQWIMANLVKHPEIQEKVYDEIVKCKGFCPGLGGQGKMVVVEEEDLPQMLYLKAVVLEGLRLHPPSHLVTHSVSEEVKLDGYVMPTDARINYMVAEIGRDPNVWDDPMEFKPDRFLNTNGDLDAFDITGSRGIKMMPFGVGRRMCSGVNLALLHLEYFVANLVWYFEWKAPDGVHVDLSEKVEFTVVMKNPLLVHLSPRPKM